MLRQDIVSSIFATLGYFKQNSFNIHIRWYVYNFMFGYLAKNMDNKRRLMYMHLKKKNFESR